MTTITDVLKRLREFESAATSGPWACNEADEPRGGYNRHAGWFSLSKARTEDMIFTNQPEMGMMEKHADAAFIVAARAELPRLLDEIERLQAENATLSRFLEAEKEQCSRMGADNVRRMQRLGVKSPDGLDSGIEALEATLAETAAARDEALDAWERWHDGPMHIGLSRDRVAALRGRSA